ncbi:MAG: dihydrodipicolinate synthase family protein [Acidobacteria bacterium]|nr:dihydrodipicolinate synthase family protein [Acidobacteriota bacterium]
MKVAAKGAQWKEWAKDHMRGLENTIIPSFTPDLSKLDEAGIRWDVQQSIRHGFFSLFCPLTAGLTFEENQRFIEIVASEAKGKALVSLILRTENMKQSFQMLQHAERVGVSHWTIAYPPSFYARSLDEIYRFTRELCEAANLGVVLYVTESFDFARFHPSSVPFDLYDRLVEIPNVMGMKVGFPEPGMVFECFRRYSHKIQVNIGNVGIMGLFPALITRFPVQWGGAGIWEVWQSPEKPYMVELFDHVLKGRPAEAFKIYWFLTKANVLNVLGGKQTMGGFDLGMINWAQGKYIIWSVGGNGGPLRQPQMSLTRRHMEARKAALRAIGIPPREPEEEFLVGRVNFNRK